MKTLLSIILIAIALSLCNLMGRRGNTNEHANSRPSGTSSETNQSPSPEPNTRPPATVDSAPPPLITERSGSQQPNSSKPGVTQSVPPLAQTTPRPPPRAPISGGVLNGKALSLPPPVYPAIAKAAHASGRVTVQVVVNEQGNVISANAISGHPLLQASAVAAARKARFSPTQLSGQPVKVSGIVIYNFVAQ